MSISNDRPTRSKQSIKSRRQLPSPVIGVIGAIIVALIGLVGNLGLPIITTMLCNLNNSCPPTPTALPTNIPETVEFPFETGIMGWVAERSATDSLGCIGVAPSGSNPNSPKSYDGIASLMMNMDLSGGDSHQSKGEVWVDLRNDSRFGTPQNLLGRTITVQVYSPQGSLGDPKHPNGIQVFVKDDNDWKSEYGTWTNISEGQWMLVTLTVSASPPPKGDMTPGFNPERIIAIGVKMGTGKDSTETYRGPIYVDAIDW